jgi:multisubunit Na+/H+ antiporter MnhF subunit
MVVMGMLQVLLLILVDRINDMVNILDSLLIIIAMLMLIFEMRMEMEILLVMMMIDR